jgi:hypothetical protein
MHQAGMMQMRLCWPGIRPDDCGMDNTVDGLETFGAKASAGTVVADHLNPYLRDAAVTIVPQLTDDQLARLGDEVRGAYPYALVSRLSDHTAFVHGIPVRARSPQDADRTLWQKLNDYAHAALSAPGDVEFRVTSIDVRSPNGLD